MASSDRSSSSRSSSSTSSSSSSKESVDLLQELTNEMRIAVAEVEQEVSFILVYQIMILFLVQYLSFEIVTSNKNIV